HALEHHWRVATVCTISAISAGWAASGLTTISADEVGVVRRTGSFLKTDLGPGLHYCWPWPIDEVTKLQPGRVRAVEVGFRSQPTAAGPLTWESLHADGLVRIPDEAAMLTGDGNLVELLASVRYRIADPHLYLTAAREPAVVLHATAEAAMREEVAARPFAELLTTGRGPFAAAVHRRLTPAAAALGLALDAVTLHDLHPPAEVVGAYREVARAAEVRDRTIHEAEAAAIRTRRDAEAKALTVRRDAEAKAAEIVAQASAAADAFAAWHAAFAAESSSTGVRRMVEMRLAWEALTDALAGRPKAIIDADRLPGRRQLYLLDPILPPIQQPKSPPVATGGPPGKQSP
ncbi:MAG: protease modulator HflK, partial [Gemmataceae bacterium]